MWSKLRMACSNACICHRICAWVKLYRKFILILTMQKCICLTMDIGYRLICMYRGFAQHGTHIYVHYFVTPFGFFFVRRGLENLEKNNRKHLNFWYTSWEELKFQPSVCVLILLSLSCNLVLWYELNKMFWDILLCFPIPHRVKETQHDCRDYDDLLNWLNMTSHENLLLLCSMLFAF